MPFAHHGFRTVSVKRHPSEFPAHSRHLYGELLADGLIEELPLPIRPSLQPLVAATEAKAFIEGVIQRWQESIEEKLAKLVAMVFFDRGAFRQAIRIAKQGRLPFLVPKPLMIVVPKAVRGSFTHLDHGETDVRLEDIPPGSAAAVRYMPLVV